MVSIAIDGPAGAGKSSICTRLAQELHYLHIDTGAVPCGAPFCAAAK